MDQDDDGIPNFLDPHYVGDDADTYGRGLSRVRLCVVAADLRQLYRHYARKPRVKILQDALYYLFIFFLMVMCTIVIDVVLHTFGMVTWGRFMGYWGTGLLSLSFIYSARKRKLIKQGRPQHYLPYHELLAWLGAVMVMVHGGIHFNAALPWLAMAAMLISVASGLTGKFLLKQSKAVVGRKRVCLQQQGLDQESIENRLYWDALMVHWMKQWRKIHIPITSVFVLLSLLHILSILLFWRW